MLGKMMIHGLVAAILIGGAAAVYAQARADGPTAQSDNGYLQPGTDGARTDRDGRKHAAKSERDAEGRHAEARHAQGQKGQNKPHDHDD
jgi:hypothetical protein